MTKYYRISTLENDEIKNNLKYIVSKQDNLNKFGKFIQSNFTLQDKKIKMIEDDLYEIFIKESKEPLNLGNLYVKFKELDLEKLPYSNYIFTFNNNEIVFFISEEDKIYDSNSYFILTNNQSEFDKFCNDKKIDNFYIREPKSSEEVLYKVGFNDNYFIIFQKFQNEENFVYDNNILKILLIELIYLRYKEIAIESENKLKNDFDKITVDEIITLRKNFFKYKITTNYKIKADRKEASEIFTIVKKL